MRALATIWLVSLISPIAISQTTELKEPAAAATKPAWEWTLDERIAKRLDPAEIRERALAKEKHLVEHGGFKPEEIIPVRFTIEGRRDPELFMPFELFGTIFRCVVEEPDRRDGARLCYLDEIAQSGWDDEFFRQTLQDATVEYKKVQDERLALTRRAESLSTAERRNLNIKAEALQPLECGLRASALQTIRRTFGAEKFDRFLYEKVAPNISISSNFPFGNEEWRLRYIEGGCK